MYLNFSLGKVTLSICHGIVHNMAEMMPPSLIHRAGMTRIIGSGGGLCRNPILEALVRCSAQTNSIHNICNTLYRSPHNICKKLL